MLRMSLPAAVFQMADQEEAEMRDSTIDNLLRGEMSVALLGTVAHAQEG